FDRTGTNLLYSTFLGGNGDDQVNAMAVDAFGNVGVVGMTDSINFPVLNAVQPVGNQGFFISTNGAWHVSNSGLTNGAVTLMRIDPFNPSNLYVVAAGFIYKSSDAGGHWTGMNNGLGGLPAVVGLAPDPVNAGTLYAAGFAGVSKSVDGGTNWVTSTNGLP